MAGRGKREGDLKNTDRSEQLKRPLSRNRILRAAVAIADRGGIETLSMRKIAEDLNVKAMSLYNHVSNKDDIIDGIVDLVIAEIELPDPYADWKTAMWRRAISAHEVLSKHPWASMVLMSRVNSGPNMLRYIDATLACLCEAGFSYSIADYAWNAIDNHIYGFTLRELSFPFEPSEYADQAESHLSLIQRKKYPYFVRLAEMVINGEHTGVQDFNFGLELILDGLERYRNDPKDRRNDR